MASGFIDHSEKWRRLLAFDHKLFCSNHSQGLQLMTFKCKVLFLMVKPIQAKMSESGREYFRLGTDSYSSLERFGKKKKIAWWRCVHFWTFSPVDEFESSPVSVKALRSLNSKLVFEHSIVIIVLNIFNSIRTTVLSSVTWSDGSFRTSKKFHTESLWDFCDSMCSRWSLLWFNK